VRQQALTVLFVERSSVLGERLVRLVLGRRGVAVALATSVDEALTQLRTSRFELVVVDLDAGPRGGLSELRRLRGAATGSHLVILTADSDPETVAACRGLGAEAVVPLASAGGGLMLIVDELLERRSARPG
jgi:DNA-binding response OmpR family regulator